MALCALLGVAALHAEPAEPASTGRVEMVAIPTPMSAVELETRFPYRVPANYNPERPEMWRVLVIFGGLNTDGVREARGETLEFPEWADKEGIFLVCPGFKQDDYWEPEVWSGKALTDALAEIKKNYNICTDKLLYYGNSAGANCANLFAAWRPDMARAYVLHGGRRFHEPTRAMRDVAALVTCGDVDYGCIEPSRAFVNNHRKLGVDIQWKFYPNLTHNTPSESLALARAFFSHHHRLHLSDLSGEPADEGDGAEDLPRPVVAHPFVGDDVDGFVYRADDERVGRILPEDRVGLPTEAIARAWGTPTWIEEKAPAPVRVEEKARPPAPVKEEEPNRPLLIHEGEEEVAPVQAVPGFQ